jgi:hypothetical protein
MISTTIATLLILGTGLALTAQFTKLKWQTVGRTLVTMGFTIIGVGFALWLTVGTLPMDVVRALGVAGVLVVCSSGLPFMWDAIDHAESVARARADKKRRELLYN